MAKKHTVPSGIDSKVVLEAEYLLEGVGERLAKTKLPKEDTERPPSPPPVNVARVRSDNPTVLFGTEEAVNDKQATETSGQACKESLQLKQQQQQQNLQDIAKKTTVSLKEDQSTYDTSTNQTSQVPSPKNNKKGDGRKKKKKKQQDCCCYCC